MLDMSAASVPLISTLSMSNTVVKSSLSERSKRESQAGDVTLQQKLCFQISNNVFSLVNTHLLDCMSTVPLLMMSRSSTAHSVVCWVLR